MPEVTAILLNWKREENVLQMIRSLKNQTVKPDIMIWDNGWQPDSIWEAPCFMEETYNPDTHYFLSPKNYRTAPRWLLASLALTPYILVMDDDLIITKNDFVEIALRVSQKYNQIIGVEGREVVTRGSQVIYGGGEYPFPKSGDVQTQIVLGKCMFLKREWLSRVPLVVPGWNWMHRGDDIIINWYVNKFKGILSKELYKRIEFLSEGKESLWRDPSHFQQRVNLIVRLLNPPQPVIEVKPNPNRPAFWDHRWYPNRPTGKPKVTVTYNEIAKMMPDKGRVLDVGCGQCDQFEEIKRRRNLDLVGIDFSNVACRRSKRRGYHVLCKKVPPLPFADKSFDVVIGTEILELTDKDWFLYQEMRRVGKNVILTIPDAEPKLPDEHRHVYRRDDFPGLVTKRLHDGCPRILAYSPGLEQKDKIKKVFLALSGYSGFNENMVFGLLNAYMGVTRQLQKALNEQEGDEFNLSIPKYTGCLPNFYFNYSTCNLNKTKDALGKAFLATDCDYMFILDSDMSGDFGASIQQLIEDDKDIVSGFYVRKDGTDDSTVGYHVPGEGIMLPPDFPDNTLTDNYKGYQLVVPTGFTLIKRDVLLAMKYPRFDYLPLYNLRIGTDWTFCLRAWELGFRVWCDSRVKLGHIGQKAYTSQEYFSKTK